MIKEKNVSATYKELWQVAIIFDTTFQFGADKANHFHKKI